MTDTNPLAAGANTAEHSGLSDHSLDDRLTPETTPVGQRGKPRSLWSDAWHDLRRNPVFIVASLILLLLVLIALFPQLFTSQDPTAVPKGKLREVSLAGPSDGHLMGFNKQGQDVYSRVIYGARASMAVGILVTLGAVLLGGTIGALAGYFGGWVDAVLSRITDVFFAIPLLLGAIVFMSGLSKDSKTIWTVVLALILLGWPGIARIMRAAVLQVKNMDFVTAAKALGASRSRILLRHVLPNAISPVIVIATISLGGYIVTEATLSFLGIGLPPSVISWGQDISQAQKWFRQAPHVLFFPAGALSLTVLCFMLIGDAVRDALDPKMR